MIGPFPHTTAGLATLYAILHRVPAGTVVAASGGGALADTTANWPSADVALSDTGKPRTYTGTEPAGMAAGTYSVSVWRMAGATPDRTVDEHLGGPATLVWDGTAEIVGANLTHANYVAVEADDTLADAIANVTTRLGAGVIRIIGSVVNYDLVIGRGESYNTTIGQTLVFTKASGDTWPTDITGWTITLNARKKASNPNTGTSTLQATGTVTQATGASQAFRIDLTAAQTTGLAEGHWTHSITLTSGLNLKAIRGNMTVLPELPVDP